MFKIAFLLLGLYAALSLARPSYLPHTEVLPSYETTLSYAPTIVGHAYESLPTAVSHQSSTIVHEKRPYLRPIVEHTPTYLKSYSPALSYSSGLSYAAPLSYGGWYEPGWSGSVAGAYPTIYVK